MMMLKREKKKKPVAVSIRTPPAFAPPILPPPLPPSIAVGEGGQGQHSESLFLTIFHCKEVTEYCRSIALLTCSSLVDDEQNGQGSLPPVELQYAGRRVFVQCETVGKTTLLPSDFKAAWRYTVQVLRFLAFSDTFDDSTMDKLPYFILPVLRSERTSIDWQEVLESNERPQLVPLSESGLMETVTPDSLGALEDRTVLEGTSFAERPLCPIRLRNDVRLGDLSAVCDDGSTVSVTVLESNGKFKKVDIASVRKDQALLEVLSVPKADDYLPLSKEEKSKSGPQRFITIPDVCQVGPMSVSMLRACRMLPSIVTQLSRSLLAHEVNLKLLRGAITKSALLERALTMSNARPTKSFEQLEFFGDSILKFCTTCLLFCQDPLANEGMLGQRRGMLISNAKLEEIANTCLIDSKWTIANHVFAEKPLGKHWCPPSDERPTKITMSEKGFADLVEALLGAAWLSRESNEGGEESIQGALEVLNRMGIVKESISWNSLRALYALHDQSHARAADVNRLALLEEVLQYRFTRPHLARQAVTHSSLVAGSVLTSYERLEFLGDAVIEYCCTRWLWHTLPDRTEHDYTVMKAYITCNNSLAHVSITSGLDRFLLHSVHTLDAQIDRLSRTFALHAREHAPKQLADVVESLFGAILLDSDFNLRIVNDVFRHLFGDHLQRALRHNPPLIDPPPLL